MDPVSKKTVKLYIEDEMEERLEDRRNKWRWVKGVTKRKEDISGGEERRKKWRMTSRKYGRRNGE